MRVFSLISNGDPIDKKLLDGFLMKTGNDRLSQDEFLYFMTRFNRNKDKLI